MISIRLFPVSDPKGLPVSCYCKVSSRILFFRSRVNLFQLFLGCIDQTKSQTFTSTDKNKTAHILSSPLPRQCQVVILHMVSSLRICLPTGKKGSTFKDVVK